MKIYADISTLTQATAQKSWRKLPAGTNEHNCVTVGGVTPAHVPLEISNIYFTASWDPWTGALDELMYSQGLWKWALHLYTSPQMATILRQMMKGVKEEEGQDLPQIIRNTSGLRGKQASFSVRQVEKILEHTLTIKVSNEYGGKTIFSTQYFYSKWL